MNKNKLVIAAGIVIVGILAVIISTKGIGNKQEVSDTQNSTSEDQGTQAHAFESGDLVIPVVDITQKASFYAYEVDGTKLEVIAIKATDGTIRTAFNTCQVCYDSGKGYYKQEGDYLVCQNCGNRFAASDVEVTKGGCNPVPILDENKTVDATNITISKDFLQEATVIFENWKS